MHMQSTGRRRRDSTKHIWYAHASSLQAMFVHTAAKPSIDRSTAPRNTSKKRKKSPSKRRNLHVCSVLESRGSRGFRVVLALATQTTSHPALLLRAEVRFGTCGNRVYPNFHRRKWQHPSD
ncbi:hypothetical protein PGTUg99_008695 [Puccinia graminis f. sp. tritici]|uniref:Uncharacterized protein n=2 Tax=Puccinia graminis f. sp. tritici TaxID=56615 RepID=A0A5B0MI94_PUCGR|nr:hypothetical protein PGTUg99_008695 [Puccinia graminis f. sp. tritici]